MKYLAIVQFDMTSQTNERINILRGICLKLAKYETINIKKPCNTVTQHLIKNIYFINNGNCTEWRAIWSEIKRVITKSIFLSNAICNHKTLV